MPAGEVKPSMEAIAAAAAAVVAPLAGGGLRVAR
jgi:hypothetical protein